MPLYYMLDARGDPIATDDVIAWGRWYERADRRLAVTAVGASRVSTVFLGLDHNFFDGAFPVLWETLVIGGPLDGPRSGTRHARRPARAMRRSSRGAARGADFPYSPWGCARGCVTATNSPYFLAIFINRN